MDAYNFFLLFSAIFAMFASCYTNECVIKHDDCSYKLILKESTCKAKRPYGQMLKDSAPVIENTVRSDDASIKKLDHLEKKLTKLMDNLSVRSLRHMRKIRSEMKHMATAIQMMKTSRKRRSKTTLECPPDFHGFGTWTSCYKFSTFPSMWREAREYCSALGANLVALETSKEQYVIDYLIKSNKGYQEAKGWWTSGQYIPRSNRWMWTSQHHLKPMDATSWARGEPDDRSTNHCLIMFKPTQYKWNDAQCMDQYNFICELDLSLHE